MDLHGNPFMISVNEYVVPRVNPDTVIGLVEVDTLVDVMAVPDPERTVAEYLTDVNGALLVNAIVADVSEVCVIELINGSVKVFLMR